jgi:protein O-mannosyl-transferase
MGGVSAAAKNVDLISQTSGTRSWWKRSLPVFILFAVTLVLYYPTHNYAFFAIDDGLYVYQNPHVLGPLDWSTVRWALTHSYVLNYDPLTFFAHSLDVQLFQVDPGRHHEVNVVWHALDVVLLFWVLRRATGFTGRSFMVAGLFALHPINVENVAWVAELKTLLSTAFFFLALGAYRWYARRPMLRRMAPVAFLYGLALLAKPQVITLPFVLLLWDYWPLRRMFAGAPEGARGTVNVESFPPASFRKLLWEKIPLFLIGAADAVVTIFAEHKGDVRSWPYTFSIRLGNAILSYARYIGKLFWPFHLAYFYPHPGYALRWSEVWAALFFLIAVSTLVILERERRYLFVGWFWYLGTMVPLTGLVQFDLPALADRWVYIGFVGLFVMICWSAADLAEGLRLPKPVLPVASLLALIVLAALTHRQMTYWSDSVAVWSHSLEVNGRSWAADVNLAAFAEQRGDLQQALSHLYHAAEDKPTNVDINLAIAGIENERGNYQQAILYYQKVVTFSKAGTVKAKALTNMGHAYSALGDEAHALECYRAAERNGPPLSNGSQ